MIMTYEVMSDMCHCLSKVSLNAETLSKVPKP